MEEESNWRRALLNVGSGVAENRGTRYPDPVFDRAAIRLRTNAELRRAFLTGNETTGELETPLLTLHTTGDGQVPIYQMQRYQRKVDLAGAGSRLVQRVLRDPGHCGFNNHEWAANLDVLAEWVEHGRKPAGTDVMVHDLRRLRPTYEVLPHAGTRRGKRSARRGRSGQRPRHARARRRAARCEPCRRRRRRRPRPVDGVPAHAAARDRWQGRDHRRVGRRVGRVRCVCARAYSSGQSRTAGSRTRSTRSRGPTTDDRRQRPWTSQRATQQVARRRLPTSSAKSLARTATMFRRELWSLR